MKRRQPVSDGGEASELHVKWMIGPELLTYTWRASPKWMTTPYATRDDVFRFAQALRGAGYEVLVTTPAEPKEVTF